MMASSASASSSSSSAWGGGGGGGAPGAVLDESVEARPAETQSERRHLKEFEEVIAILSAVERLEKAFIRDAVGAAE
jgi:hypothetical protein